MVVRKEQQFIESSVLDWETVGQGVRRKIIAYDDQLMAVCVEFKKGSIGCRHSHPQRQITYIQCGSYEVNIGDEKKILKSGDCYYIPSNIEHGVVALEDSMLIDVFNPMREDFINPMN